MSAPGSSVSNPVKGHFGGCGPRLLAAMLVLLVLLLVAAVGSAMSGAVRIPLDAMPALLGVASDSVPTSSAAGHPEYRLWEGVLLDIRLPRILLGMLAGAALAVAGAVMQALFRNPLAEPGLVGGSVGGAVGAVGAIVLGYGQQPLVLAGAAFAGSLLATLAAWALGRKAPGSAGILLAGIAINAFGGAMLGVFTYMATDDQLRSLTFWNLGSLGTADWTMLAWLAPWTLGLLVLLLWQWRALNALLLGEREALHLGFELQRLRARLILLVTLLVGPLVAVTGIIGFVGLVVPHLVRLVAGADHRSLLPLSLLAGALILVLADWVARIVVIPAELPIGIVTSLLGAPVLFVLIQREAR